MQSEVVPRVLVVARATADEPELVTAIRERAARGPGRFDVLVPNPAAAEWHPLHPEGHDRIAEAAQRLTRALPALEDAAAGRVEALEAVTA